MANITKKRGTLFGRFFRVSITLMLTMALFATLLFNIVCKTVFTQLKENEMLSKAQALEGFAIQLIEGRNINSGSVFNAQETFALLESALLITDKKGKIVCSVGLEDAQQYESVMQSAAAKVSDGNTVRFSRVVALRKSNLVGIAVPVTKKGKTIGAIVMLVPMYEALLAKDSLNTALLLSILLSLPFVVLLSYTAIRRIVQPLRHMRDVAMRMADGDFSVKADSSQRGEIGQLGRSLNYMSSEVMRLLSQMTLERNRLRQVVDGLSEGIVAVDALGRVTLSNPAMAALFGTNSDAAQLSTLIPYPDVQRGFDEALATGKEMCCLHENAEKIIETRVYPLRDKNGRIAGALGMFADVTERERLERTRRDYVANVSHELRSPLTGMRALVEPMHEGLVKDETSRQRYYGIILKEITRLTRLINDLMELSRLQSGTMALQKSVTDMKEIIWGLDERFTAKAEEKKQVFTITDAARDCPDVFTNPDRAEQLLVILLDNAMKYTPEGGTITLDVAEQEEFVTLTVSDSGCGISQKDLPYVFDRFYKVDKAHSGQGSGLGLSIAKELLERMGETIRVESEEGKGSSFSFTLHKEPREEKCSIL